LKKKEEKKKTLIRHMWNIIPIWARGEAVCYKDKEHPKTKNSKNA
jgi:hypothetical protein